jgi:hypothetical protein
MAIDRTIPRSRRALLAAGAGGLFAAVAGVLGRPLGVRAADGDPLVIGQSNTGTSTTTLTQTTNGVAALSIVGSAQYMALTSTSQSHIAVAGSSGSGTGVAGSGGSGGGVEGSSANNYGVRGTGSGPAGVMGQNQHGRIGVFGYTGPGDPPKPQPHLTAVYGRGQDQDGIWSSGVRGDSDRTAGVVGYSGPVLDVVPGAYPKTGVYGFSDTDFTARGVAGSSTQGTGVHGLSTTGKGVYGRSTASTGVRGQSDDGTGVWATSLNGLGAHVTSGAGNKAGLLVQNTTGRAAIVAVAGPGSPPAPENETGVQAVSSISPNSVAVLGASTQGLGIYGTTDNGFGVVGTGYYGVYGTGVAGVVGDVNGGTGVQGWTGVAFAPVPASQVGVWAGAESGRTALQVQGVAKFSRSGKVTFSAGQVSKTVNVPGGISSGSMGFAVLQTSRAGVYVRAVTPSSTAGTIRIVLNQAVSGTTSVAWQVLG